MSYRNNFAEGEFYHLYNRGTEKRSIFSNKNDYQRFVSILYLCNSEKQIHIGDILPRGSTSGEVLQSLANVDRGKTLVDIGAYCLMPNHFHLLVREQANGNISRFMQKLMTAYTMYFNKRHERSGALFQGKFKSTHAGEDRYLKYLISYIHLNPVKLVEPKWKETGIANRKKARAFLEQYEYSSYLDYSGEKRIQNMLLKKDSLPDYFESSGSFEKSISDWLDYARD